MEGCRLVARIVLVVAFGVMLVEAVIVALGVPEPVEIVEWGTRW